MWIKTHDGQLVNLARATRVRSAAGFHGEKGHQVVAVFAEDGAAASVVIVFRGEEAACRAFLDRIGDILGADSGEDREVRVL